MLAIRKTILNKYIIYMEVPNQLNIADANIGGIYTRQEDINNKPSWINEEANAQICLKDSKWIIEDTNSQEIFFTESNWPNVEVVE